MQISVSTVVGVLVALRKESVDRNVDPDSDTLTDDVVALRKESVDRNAMFLLILLALVSSLSARRAWIEIIDYIIDYATDASRSPQGERG